MSNKIIQFQRDIDKKIIESLKKDNYTFDNPLIIIDPYKINPLSAYVCFKTDKQTKINTYIIGKNEKNSIHQTFPLNQIHILPIFGLYADHNNKVIIEIYQGRRKIINIPIDHIPYIDSLVIESKIEHHTLKNQFLMFSSPVTWFDYSLPFAIDDSGEVRWIIQKPFNFCIKQLNNGHFLASTGKVIKQPYFTDGLYEFDWMGKIYSYYNVPNLFHHDFFELINGNLIVLTNSNIEDSLEDSLIEIDRNSKKIIKTWNYKDFINPDDCRKHGSSKKEDWFHNNSVWYDSTNDSVILSSRHTDAIFSLNYTTQEINWILSNPIGWNKDIVKKYFLKPKYSSFNYTYGQHSARIMDNGWLCCFDNHYFGKDSPDYVPAKDSYSRAVCFKINLQDNSVEETFSFGEKYYSDLFSSYISNITPYSPSNYLVHFGGLSFENGEVSNYSGPKGFKRGVDMESKTFEIDNGEITLYCHTRGNYYRANKMNFKVKDYSFN
ncbi:MULTISPECIES: aryl-sulfate sulfotransferase [Aerococcus]|nr:MULTISPECIES: aryl-sulfate sulfotransferase [Aerococcus]MDK6688152.1 aryl-sulfate sulfotransferase [Aerococcus urinae]MDK8132728.1 aryl-sulfate sulfotransferase [Aerococcus urinae]MDK8484352.1 aryl-sulfate sulfotransferase [Aerococcus urinae]MDL5179366.1 aryl-sulfate sulfotransferase [Aerococcus tenax]MDL5208267.1 aryl-sulfate sulfotransferase [Aerococcus tenax]